MPTGMYPRTSYHKEINKLSHIGLKHSQETRKK